MVTFGGWPVLGTNKGGNWDENAYNFEDLMLKITPFKVCIIIIWNGFRAINNNLSNKSPVMVIIA